jgi:alpha-methylacyl-CoA racemase
VSAWNSSGGSGPLGGVRIIELAGMGVVPYAAMVLADLGADVIRVDRAIAGQLDVPESLRGGRPLDFLVRRNRPSIALNLKTVGGTEIFLRLVEEADGLLEGFRPGVMERLGIGPDECHARNPSLVFVRSTGWGQDGPYANAPGHDLNYIALTGALLAMGRRGSPPAPPLNLVGDYAGGALFGVIGLLSGILHARQTGKGQVVDASIIDGAAHMTTLYHGLLAIGGWTDERQANLLDGGSPTYDVYETSDGGYISVVGGEPEFLEALLDVLGLTGLAVEAKDPKGWPKVRGALERVFLTKTRQEWSELLAGKPNLCCAPVLSFSEAPDDVHNRARHTYVTQDGIVQPAPAPRFSATPGALKLSPSQPGQQTNDVLRGLGFSDEEIQGLVDDGAVRQA